MTTLNTRTAANIRVLSSLLPSHARARTTTGKATGDKEKTRATRAVSTPHRAKTERQVADDGQDGRDVAMALHEQRSQRLAGARQGCARLSEVIRLVTCGYNLRTLWLPDDLDGGDQSEWMTSASSGVVTFAMIAEIRAIAARLASAGQIPLVIGDPAHRTLWLARRPFALVEQRRRTGLRVLESVRTVARDVASGATDNIERLRDDPATQLMRLCGPAGRVLVAQSDVLLTLAPQIAMCPPEHLMLRWVLAAPQGIYNARGAQTLTTWTERLLCLAISPAMSAQG